MTVSEVTASEMYGYGERRLQMSNGCRNVGYFLMAVSGLTVTKIDGYGSEYFRNDGFRSNGFGN